MIKKTLSGWSKARLRFVLTLFFFALAIPTAILIYQAYSQLKWESFHHYREQAEELTNRIDLRYKQLIDLESARSFTDYSFLNIAGKTKDKVLQRSPLSDYPISSKFPGVIGYFQVDNNGEFSSPLLALGKSNPAKQRQDFGITAEEMAKRNNLHKQVYQLLSQNKLLSQPKKRLAEKEVMAESVEQDISQYAPTISSKEKSLQQGSVASEPATTPSAVVALPQAAFDKLQSQDVYSANEELSSYKKSRKRVEDLKLKKKYQAEIFNQQKTTKFKQQRQKSVRRTESNILPDYRSLNKENKKDAKLKINMFESEIDAFEFSLLESGHFVLYRKVWRNGLRYIQGLLIKPDYFINNIVGDSFYQTNVSKASHLTLAYKGNILSTLKSKSSRRSYSSSMNSWDHNELQGTLLLQSKLSSPLEQLELVFSVDKLPVGPGGTVIIWLSIILLVILCGGFIVLYILGLKQLNLARQQQDFISAVSHELKTPLTSIRMYGEMLREGWTTEEKRNQYYDYIYDESERLTRLINNVLQLARMTRNDLAVDLKQYSISELIDTLKSKVSSQVERAEFELIFDCGKTISDKTLLIDIDFFIQIFINLVDNAIKFSMNSSVKKIEVHCRLLGDKQIQFSIRDYGPGISKDQMRKIFQLFYRSEDELTRETVGTGIGLSLVKQLVSTMGGSIDVISKEPGAEFQIRFNADDADLVK